ncbi:MAG: 50S ribosomal protein L19 [Patescibacteria group bacterium]
MIQLMLHEQAKKYLRNLPELQTGATVRVHEKIQEGEKQRVQIFEGLIIGMHRGHTGTDRSFTVRRIASGVGVERVFSLHSPVIEKIEVKKIAKVRRAKLNFLRGRRGKSARLNERFTTDEEFGIAVQQEPVAVAKEEEIVQAKEEKPEALKDAE